MILGGGTGLEGLVVRGRFASRVIISFPVAWRLIKSSAVDFINVWPSSLNVRTKFETYEGISW